MAVRPFITAPAPVLSTPAAPVSDFGPDLAALITDLRETCAAPAASLTAPQIGVGQQVVVARADGHETVLCNPRLIEATGSASAPEQCESAPGMQVQVARATRITIQGQDAAGRPLLLAVTGDLARVLQHALDHLAGVLITAHGDAVPVTPALAAPADLLAPEPAAAEDRKAPRTATAPEAEPEAAPEAEPEAAPER